MPDHLEFSKHLTAATFDEKIKNTFLGQVHIAGTGPSGKTCRECFFYQYVHKGRVAPYEYYGGGNKETARQLKKCRCTYPMPHKAKRGFPHWAKSCSLFQQSKNPPPSVDPKNN